MEQQTGICRTCLVQPKNGLRDIFTEIFDYSEIIHTLTQLTVLPGDSLSQKICRRCALKIENTQKFKLMCLESDKVLNEKLQINLESNAPLNKIEVCLIQEIHEFNEVQIKIESPEESIADDSHQECFTNKDDEEVPLKMLMNRESVPKKEDKTPIDEKTEIVESMTDDDSHQEICMNEDISYIVTDDDEMPLKMLHNTKSAPKKQQKEPSTKPEIEESIADDNNHQENFTNEDLSYTDPDDEEVPLTLLRNTKSASKKERKISGDKKTEKGTKKKPINNTLYSCEFCGKAYQKHYLTWHLNGHNKVYPFVCSVEGCDAKFTAPFRLKTHETDCHSGGNRPFTCDVCNKTYKLLKHLKSHRTYHEDPTLPCTVCNVLFKKRNALKKHMKTHTGEKPYSCQYCDKPFANNYNLKTHLRTHTGDKPYKCNFCEAAFSHGSSLKIHLEKNHSDKVL